jgi:hypothetical protein
MRIISKLRDYYDSGAAFGVDSTVVFERKPTVVTKEDALYSHIEHVLNTIRWTTIRYSPKTSLSGRHFAYAYKSLGYDYTHISLVVADKKYHGILIYRSNPITSSEYYFFWDKDSLDKWLSTKIDDSILNQNQYILSNLRSTIFGTTPTSGLLQEFMLENRIVNICYDIRGTLFGRISSNIVINSDALGLFGIQRVVDSVSMFSMVDQWVAMFSDPSRKMVVISDKSKLDKHGMDKWSFKTPPSTS